MESKFASPASLLQNPHSRKVVILRESPDRSQLSLNGRVGQDSAALVLRSGFGLALTMSGAPAMVKQASSQSFSATRSCTRAELLCCAPDFVGYSEGSIDVGDNVGIFVVARTKPGVHLCGLRIDRLHERHLPGFLFVVFLVDAESISPDGDLCMFVS